MRLLIAAPANLTQVSHLEKALALSGVEADEVLVLESRPGSVDQWVRNWAASKGLAQRPCQDEEEALKFLARGEGGVMVAVVSPDQPATLDLVAEAESQRIPVFIYRELYRQDPRVNCRFSPVERPDVWLRGVNAEQRDFFRRLHGLCSQYGVAIKTAQDGTSGSFLQFGDGTEFEGIELDAESCRVRPRGSFRNRRIPLD